MIKKRAQTGDGVVFFDLIGDDLEGYNKFIPYYLFPHSTYTVSVSTSSFRTKVSVGSNPWAPEPLKHNLATICERYGGGGHPRVGAISFEIGAADGRAQWRRRFGKSWGPDPGNLIMASSPFALDLKPPYYAVIFPSCGRPATRVTRKQPSLWPNWQGPCRGTWGSKARARRMASASQSLIGATKHPSGIGGGIRNMSWRSSGVSASGTSTTSCELLEWNARIPAPKAATRLQPTRGQRGRRPRARAPAPDDKS